MKYCIAITLLLSACWQPDLGGHNRCQSDQDCSDKNPLCQAGVCSPLAAPPANDAGPSDTGPADAGMPASGVQLLTGTTLEGSLFEPRFGYAAMGPLDGTGEGLILIFSDRVTPIINARQNRETKDGRTLEVAVANVIASDGGIRVEPPSPGAHEAFLNSNQTGAVFSAETRQYDNCFQGREERLAAGTLELDGISDTRVWGTMHGIRLGYAGDTLSLRFDLPLERRADPPTACVPVIHGNNCEIIKETSTIPEGGGYFTIVGGDDTPLRVWCNQQGWALAARVTPPNCRLWNASSDSANQSDATSDCYGLPLRDLDADSSGDSSMFKVLITAGEQTKARIYTGTDYKVWDNSSNLTAIDTNGFKRLNTNVDNTELYETSQHLRRFDAKHAWAISSCNQDQCTNEGAGPCVGPARNLCVDGYRAGLANDGFVLQKNTNGDATAISGWGDWDNTPFSTFELWVKPLPER
jgi:hypothetical protein